MIFLDVPPIIISCDTVTQDKFLTMPEFVMSLCRKHCLLKNERVTLLSSMDQMVAIQLCLAEKNKEVSVCYTPENFCKWIRLGLWCLILLSKSDVGNPYAGFGQA